MNPSEVVILQTIRKFIDLNNRRPSKFDIQKKLNMNINTLGQNITRLKKKDFIDSPAVGRHDLGYGITKLGRETLSEVERDLKSTDKASWMRISVFDQKVLYCPKCSHNIRFEEDLIPTTYLCPRCNREKLKNIL
jgi:predicted transcriptional regulator